MKETAMQGGGFWMMTEEICFDELDTPTETAYKDEDFYPDSSV
jgi:hypothetical protein